MGRRCEGAISSSRNHYSHNRNNYNTVHKYAGKYDSLYGNLIKKYGPLGQPTAAAARPSISAPGGGAKKSIGDFHSNFVTLVTKATPSLPPRSYTSVVEGKASDASNGLETSTFTVCARVRPLLPPEEGQGGEVFAAVVAGDRVEETKTSPYTEQMLLCTPKVSIMGKPKLEEVRGGDVFWGNSNKEFCAFAILTSQIPNSITPPTRSNLTTVEV